MGKLVDIAGKRFGRLVVASRCGSDKHKKAIWNCVCDCGKEEVIRGSDLSSGNTKSCGCLKDEGNSKTHGMSQSLIHKTWRGMKDRCNNPNNIAYKHYGGRGIKVCDRWANSFENFYEDMGDKPSQEYSIDRVNNDGDYEPSNCRWATTKEQANNRRVQKNNVSGVVGVSRRSSDNLWEAYFKGKYVGCSKDFEEACNLRKLAEEKGIV